MDYDPVQVRLSKSPLVKRLTKLVLVGWLTSILLAALADWPRRDFWPQLELPLGMLFYGLWLMRSRTIRRRWSLSILLITYYVYNQALPQRHDFDLVMSVVYPLLSGAIAFYVLYRIYKLVERQQQSPSDKEQTTPPSPDPKQRGAEVDSSLRSE
jgi:hypothetical protein